MNVDVGEIVKWAGEGLGAIFTGWLASTLNVNARIAKSAAELRLEFEKGVRDLREQIDRLETDLHVVETKLVDGRVQSSSDHAASAALALRVNEVREQCERSYAAMNRILGILQGKGIGGFLP